MNTADWTELLVKTFLMLLTEYMRKHSYDEAQEVVSRVGYGLAIHDPVQASLPSFGFLASPSDNVTLSSSEEKEFYRLSQGTSS